MKGGPTHLIAVIGLDIFAAAIHKIIVWDSGIKATGDKLSDGGEIQQPLDINS
jgi:hypothetical protein